MKKNLFFLALVLLTLSSFTIADKSKWIKAPGATVLNYQVDVPDVSNTVLLCNQDQIQLNTTYHFDVQGVINNSRSNVNVKVTMEGTAVSLNTSETYTHDQNYNIHTNAPVSVDGNGATVVTSKWQETFTSSTGQVQKLVGHATFVVNPNGTVMVDKNSFTFTCEGF